MYLPAAPAFPYGIIELELSLGQQASLHPSRIPQIRCQELERFPPHTDPVGGKVKWPCRQAKVTTGAQVSKMVASWLNQ